MAKSCPIKAAFEDNGFKAVSGAFALIDKLGETLNASTDIELKHIGKLMEAVDRLSIRLYYLQQEAMKKSPKAVYMAAVIDP